MAKNEETWEYGGYTWRGKWCDARTTVNGHKVSVRFNTGSATWAAYVDGGRVTPTPSPHRCQTAYGSHNDPREEPMQEGIDAALLVPRDTNAWPEWARTALAAGWAPPRGWAP